MVSFVELWIRRRSPPAAERVSPVRATTRRSPPPSRTGHALSRIGDAVRRRRLGAVGGCRMRRSRKCRRAPPSCFESASSFFFSPLLNRQFSSSTASPAATSTPFSQSRLSGTSCRAATRDAFATGASDLASSKRLPSAGRDATQYEPRPFFERVANTRSAARYVSSEIAPSFIGTLKSRVSGPACRRGQDPPSLG